MKILTKKQENMAVEKQINKNVLEMARTRIKNLFETAPKIYFSVSGGKDSTVLMDLVYKMIKEEKISPEKLVCRFIDEEAMFDDVIENVKIWRKKFLSVGVKFNWYCIQIKHFNCLNSLSSDESFICWDANKKDRWVRKIPKFAITNHPQLREKIETYQDFLSRISQDGITMMGVRLSESIHRRVNMVKTFTNASNGISLEEKKAFPIYDWKDGDVWKYIKDNDLYFPETYIQMYKCGRSRNMLRISQFFSIDTVRILSKMKEYNPNLMEKVEKREPNSYLAVIYWDTGMFKTKKGIHKKEEKNQEKVNYKKEVFKLMEKLLRDRDKLKEIKTLRKTILKNHQDMTDTHWRKTYEILNAGDVKNRSVRSLVMKIFNDRRKKWIC